MKNTFSIKRVAICLATIALLVAASASRMQAAALNAQLVPRPLTPQEITMYGLTGALKASGLTTVPVGQPTYLDALINNAVTNTDIPVVTWTLTNTPPYSTAGLTNSPLGTNVPTYKMADRPGNRTSLAWKVAGRRMLTPDQEGTYTIKVSITTGTSGSTNLTLVLTAAKYRGIDNCALCHSGSVIAPDKYTDWFQTKHAHAFEEAIDGKSTDHFTKNCISCHAVGFDGNTNSNNGGFDDIAAQTGWVFPTTLTYGNWAAMPPALQNVANIQCENCHGPGSQHIYGSPTLGNTNLISVSFIQGNCAQCHDALTHHVKATEWSGSMHAVVSRTPSGPNRYNCVRCHTAPGFAQYIAHAGNTNTYATNTVYEAITCAACHDPHDATNPHQLRAANTYTLPEGTTVTNAGLGALCMNCHHSRNGAAETNVYNFAHGLPTWAGGSSFGPHDSTAGDMVEGVNAITYGKYIPSSAHSYVVTNVCVTCHMQPVATTDPAFGKAGGHTFSMTYTVGSNTNAIDKVDVCVKCHGPISGFDFARKDYDGDGNIQGVQTEVQNLLNRLSTLLPGSAYRADGNYVADGLVKSSISAKTNWQTKFLNAGWNWQFVNVEGSKGVHNASYAVGVLKASIADLTGDANNDGLPDTWQIQYFGSATNPNAAPNAAPAGDGVPNWLKYSLGLDPNVPGITLPDGVIWANTSSIGGTNNTVHIYTAAEIAFDTQLGKNYQIQAVQTLVGGWQNIGTPVAGTGKAISYVTPTRSNAQQFFRVMQVP
jgi:hypothetical protein